MIRKPFSIMLLSIIFFLSPIAILVFNSALNMVPLIGYGSIIFRLRVFDFIILSLYPLTAFSIFMVKKWGWWIIISSAFFMFLYNLVSFFYNPFSSVIILLLMNFALFFTALLFFRKHLIAPYFNPRLRWWEQDQRYEIDIYLRFLGLNKNVIISDISEGGCYIFVDFLIESGTELPVLIVCGSFHITLQSRIMRIAKESDRYYGYGLMFLKIDEVEKDGLKKLIKKLKSFSSYESENIDSQEKRTNIRYFIGYDLSVISENETSPGNLEDISKSGCAIKTSIDMKTGSSCIFNYRIQNMNHKILSKVIWKKGNPGNRHYGLKFIEIDKNTKLSLKKMIQFTSKLGARKRKINKKTFYQYCEEKLDHTPYEIVRFFKRILKKKTG